jgi:hypothetical protein
MAVKLGRKFCGQKCQREHRRFPRVYSVFASGSYTPSAEHQSDSKSAHSTGLASESFEAPAIPPSSTGSVPVTIR